MMLMICLICRFNFAQNHDDNTTFNVTLDHFITGSGFTLNTEVNVRIEADQKRNLAFGVLYDHEYNRMLGASIQYEAMVFQNASREIHIKPHLFYNFIYRKITIPELGSNLTYSGNPATYTSLEHHIGIGIRKKLLKSLFMDLDCGFGVYLGVMV